MTPLDPSPAPPSPERIAAVRDEFAASRELTLGTAYPEGTTGWVGATTGPAGEDLVLKVGFAHEEARDEALGLRIWSAPLRATSEPVACPGDTPGADAAPPVPQVLEAFRDGDVSVILMARVVPGFTLATSGLTPEQEDEVVAGLLERLWIPVPPEYAPEPGAGGGDGSGTASLPDDRLRPLAHMCGWWADEAAQRLAQDPSGLPAEVIDAGLDLFRRLPLEDDVDPVLLATDLHHHNVLAATEHPTTEPEDWTVIDPKPYVGDPHYDLLQHMLNFPDRLAEDPVGFAERMAGLTGLDPDRAVRWLFARCVQETRADGIPGTTQAALALAPHVLG